MTSSQVPGRVLDRAVAEHVLHMRVEMRGSEYVMIDPRYGDEGVELPAFCMDAGAAEALAALLHMRGYDYSSEEFPLHGWQVILVPPDGRDHVEEFAETFPLALSRASLRAVGVTPPEE
jgi:hypothetical protein